MDTKKSKRRKRVVLTLDDKLKIVGLLKKGVTVQKICRDYNIGSSTVYDLKKNEAEILKFQKDIEAGEPCRKTMKKPENTALDEALFIWFLQKRSLGDPIPGNVLCEQALLFNEKLGGEPDFKASQGWLRNFKLRHGIRQRGVHREKLSADAAATDILHKIPGCSDCDDEDTREWLNRDENEIGYQILNDDEIVSQVFPEPTIEIEEEEERASHQPTVSHVRAIKAIEVILKYLEEQDEANDLKKEAVLRYIRDMAVTKLLASKKQKKNN